MWTYANGIKCPVCGVFLGRLVPNKYCSYPCVECQWIFNFDDNGKPKPPTKLNPKKPVICGCEGCNYRDEQNILKRINKL